MKKYILTAFLLANLSTLGYTAARGSGGFTTGKLSLYKVATREEPGWVSDSTTSINHNFQILSSTLTAIIDGTLSSMTTNYILNRNTIQSGTTSYAEYTQTRNLSVYGTINLPPGASNYMGLDGSNQTKIGSVTFQGGIASTGPVVVGTATFSNPIGSSVKIIPGDSSVQFFITDGSGNSFITGMSNGSINFNYGNIGIASATPAYKLSVIGDAYVSSSMTVANVVTTTSTSVGPSCASGFTRVGLSDCLDTNGTRAVDITSVPINAVSNFTTTDIPILNSTNAKWLIIRVKCQTSQDGTEGVNDVSLYVRKPGSGGSKDNTTNVCDARNRVASAGGESYTFDLNEVLVPLDANKDFDYACETTQTDNDVACYITYKGYKE